MIQKRLMLGLGAALLALTSQLPAQDYTLYFEDGIGGPAGSEQTITCKLDMPAPPVGLAGWSIGICHDVNALNPTAAADGVTTLTINGGSPADFDQINIIPNGGATAPETSGVNQAVVIAFLGGVELSAGTDYEILEITYELSGPDAFATVNYCSTTPGGAFPVETVVTQVGGASVSATLVPNTIEVGAIFPPTFRLATDLTVAAGTTTDAAVTMDNPEFDIYGFSFGVTHDASIVTLTEILPGTDTQTAEFFVVDNAPANGDGGVVAAILSLSAPLQLIGPGNDYEVAIFSYDVAGTAAVDDVSALTFVDTLEAEAGSPAVELLVSFGEIGMVPVTDDGSILVTSIGGGGGPEFIRGDCNGDGSIDIADPVYNLQFLFVAGPQDCEVSQDTNDDGGVDIADPVYNLAALFTGGPAVPAPNVCGVDPTPDTLTCVTQSCP